MPPPRQSGERIHQSEATPRPERETSQLETLAAELLRFQIQNHLGSTREAIRRFEGGPDMDPVHEEMLPAAKGLLEEKFSQPDVGAIFVRGLVEKTSRDMAVVQDRWQALPQEAQDHALEVAKILESKRKKKKEWTDAEENALVEELKRNSKDFDRSYGVWRDRRFGERDISRLQTLARELDDEYLKKPEARLARHLLSFETFTTHTARDPWTYRDRSIAAETPSFEVRLDPKLEDKKRQNETLIQNYLKKFPGQNPQWSSARKNDFREIVRALWPLVDVHVAGRWQTASHSLDSRACQTLLRLAGIENEPWTIASGTAKKRGVMLNTGDVDGVRYDAPQKMLAIDHHGGGSKEDTAASAYFYEVLNELGFFSDEKGKKILDQEKTSQKIIEAALHFTALEDNKNHPEWQNQKPGWWENESPYTLLGLATRLKFEDLLRAYGHLEKQGVPQEFWDTYRLTPEDIKTLDLEAKVKAQENTTKTARRQWDDLGEHGYVDTSIPRGSGKRGERIPRLIFRLPSEKYGTVIFTLGGFPAGIDALRGLGGREVVLVNYNPRGGSLFVSRTGAQLPADLFPPRQRQGKLIERGHLVRGRMWLYSQAMETQGNEGQIRRGADFPFTISEVCEKLGVPFEDYLAHFPLQDEVQEEGEVQSGRGTLSREPQERQEQKANNWFERMVQQKGRGFALGQARRAYQKLYEADARLPALEGLLGEELKRSYDFYEQNWPGYLRGQVEDYLQKIEKGEHTPGEVLRKLRRLRDQGCEVEIAGQKYDFSPACHIIAVILETDGAWRPGEGSWEEVEGRLHHRLSFEVRKKIEEATQKSPLPNEIKEQLAEALFNRAIEDLQED